MEKVKKSEWLFAAINNAVRKGWSLLINPSGSGWRKKECPYCHTKGSAIIFRNVKDHKRFLMICGSCHIIKDSESFLDDTITVYMWPDGSMVEVSAYEDVKHGWKGLDFEERKITMAEYAKLKELDR